jgi:stress response protein YsnF
MSDDQVRHEEEIRVDTRVEEHAKLKARKVNDVEHFVETVGRAVEDASLERVAATAEDSGEIETLPDGSVSIPLFEEELVVTKRLVVRERVIVRKHTTTEERRVEADLRRERIEIEVEDDPT